jgi:hypothetical protein
VGEAGRAHRLVNEALKSGDLVKLPCEVCGTTLRVEGHHEDYTKPLEVQWLCKKHRRQRHVEIGEPLMAADGRSLFIRDIDESLLWRLRQDAVASRRSLKDHCISLLSVDADVLSSPAVQLASTVISQGLPPEVDRVDVFAGTDTLVKVASVPVRRPHNPKTCRIYKCGQCAATKEKLGQLRAN